jgi:phospholipase/carboxylesterase
MQLHYLIREPKEILDKNPLLLLLHGYGSNEEDLFSFANELPQDHYVISVRAPFSCTMLLCTWIHAARPTHCSQRHMNRVL